VPADLAVAAARPAELAAAARLTTGPSVVSTETAEAPSRIAAGETPRAIAVSDSTAARRLVAVTIGGAALMAGLLEYTGLGIAARYGPVPVGGAFWAAWATGTAATLGGAVGGGLVASALTALRWRRWPSPRRAVAAAFALGVGAFLLGLGLLTLWAP
jgi:hypothetical protein